MAASKRPGARPARITAGLVWFHRWLGLATCLVFAMWFASGAVLLFKPFPSLPRVDRLAMMEPIDFAAVKIAPKQAIAAAGVQAASLRLVQRAGVPAYIVEGGARAVPVDATTGAVLPPLPAQAAQAESPPFDYDQWIVHNQFDPYRPFFRLPAGDEAGTQTYVSAVTGEPMQRTTAVQRAWNWVGAVLHWVYFTPLRSSFTAWDNGVWVLSFICMLVAIAGIVLGVMRTMTAMKQRKPCLSYFRLKWLRWHHLLGLFAGLFVLTWIMSGWLSMDHGRLFSRGQPSAKQAAAYEGAPLASGLDGIGGLTLARLGPARMVEFALVDHLPLVATYGPDGALRRFAGDGRPLTDAALAGRIDRAVRAAWPGAEVRAITPVAPTEMFALAEGWPASARHVVLQGGGYSDLYVDGDTGCILTVMDSSRGAYAWIYYALHTFNFPGLIERPLLREILVLIPLTLGFAFSVTGVVIGWQRLRKSI